MTAYFGDFAEDATVYIPWNTANASGASVNRDTDGVIVIYKNDSVVQKATANGITDSEAFDGQAGVHLLKIDTSVDTGDSGFWAAGNDYFVVIDGAVIDGQTVNHAIGHFSIENRATSGTNILNAIADALLNRDMSAVSDTNSRSPLNAFRAIRNKTDVAAGTLTVKKEDDSTTAWTAAVTTNASADPIVGVDPA